MFDVVVFGSCMVDFISYVQKMPKCNETLHSESFQTGFGGKGANQAIAACRLGCKTAMIAKLGADPYGIMYKEHFEKEGVNSKFVELIPSIHSGIALIVVDTTNGNNQIVINANANKYLSINDCIKAKEVFENSKVLVCQLETPVEASIVALKMFKGLSILNVAPAVKNLPEIAYATVSILCANELEAEEITGIKFETIQDAKKMIEAFLEKGCKTVIVTLGKNGAVFNDVERKIIHVPVQKSIQAVDTTGSGDMFIGALAHFHVKFPAASLMQKVAASIIIASNSTLYKGTQTSYINFPHVDIMNEKFVHFEL